MANLTRGGDRGNQYTGGKPPFGGLAIDEAAKALNVSTRSVERAGAVLKAAKSDPIAAQAAKAMEAGEMKLAKASRIALGKPDRPKKTPMDGSKKKAPKPLPQRDEPPGYRSGHEPKDRAEQLAQNFVICVNTIDKIASETTAAGLLAGMVEVYSRNLDHRLAKALDFLGAVAALHPGPGERRPTAGNGAAAAAPNPGAAEGP